jgi:hypothetical protein
MELLEHFIMSISSWLRRWTESRAGCARRRRASPCLCLETLEVRALLAAPAAPSWVFEGPAPIVGNVYVTMPDPSVSGALNGVAVNPTNPAQMYVATANGGIWKTNNADFKNPTSIVWTPVTDQVGSLATGGIAFSPLDPTNQTLFATTGSWSSFVLSQYTNLPQGGPAIGVLKTTDGGLTWTATRLNPSGSEPKAAIVLPTTLRTNGGTSQFVLVGSESGMYVSVDGGASYRSQGLFVGANINQIVADPNHANIFYAAVLGKGIYKGTYNSGSQFISWNLLNDGLARDFGKKIQLTAQNYGGTTYLFAYLAADGQTGTFYRLDTARGNATWNSVSRAPHGFQPGFFTNNIVADPANPNVFYFGGYAIGPYRGIIIGDRAVFTPISGGVGPDSTGIHPDDRSLLFVGKTLVITTDGGIFATSITNGAGPVDGDDSAFSDWVSLNGSTTGQGLGTVELHDIAYDSISHVIFGGSQDNGTEYQQSPGSLIWKPLQLSDGDSVLVDDTTLASSNQSIRYLSEPFLARFQRQVFDASNNLVQTVRLLPKLPGFQGLFVTPIALDAIAPTAQQLSNGESTRIVIGGENGVLYEADNAGTAADAEAVHWTRVPTAPGLATIRALAYGGVLNGVGHADILYAADANHIYVRMRAGGTLIPTAAPFPGADIRSIALDPNNARHLCVATASAVYETTNGGSNWINLTGNLGSLASNLRTITVVPIGARNVVLVGGFGGVLQMTSDAPGVWTKVGVNLPNAVVFSLVYNAADDVLVAAPLGRGVWELPDASQVLVETAQAQIPMSAASALPPLQDWGEFLSAMLPADRAHKDQHGSQ